MNHQDYGKIKAVNWSSLKHLVPPDGSPLLYRWFLEHPAEDKPSYQLGRAIHCAILEPDVFESRYVVYPGAVRRGKEWERFQADHQGADILLEKDMETARLCADAVRAHPRAVAYLTGGRAEETIGGPRSPWIDPVTGLACKGRADYVTSTRLVDLKSTSDGLSWFWRNAAKYLYHGQLAFYLDGLVASKALPPDHESASIVAVQTVPPYDVGVWEVGPEAIEAGRRVYREAMALLQRCISLDHWPGACPDVQALTLPAWAAGMDKQPEDDEVI